MLKKFENLLVISDNLYLAGEFDKIIRDQTKHLKTISFGVSPMSSAVDFQKRLLFDVEVLDLKNSSVIDKIIANYDVVFSIHCKQIFPTKLVKACKCINVHPGYNPYNRGWYPQVFAIIKDLPIGATIHEIDNKLDHGNIIARELVNKNTYDTSLDLYNKVINKEIKLLKLHFKKIITNQYTSFQPEEEGELFLRKDFNDLLHIDLEEKGTFKNFIDRLRALNHGDFKNSYFIDPDTGKKIFINLKLTVDDTKDQC